MKWLAKLRIDGFLLGLFAAMGIGLVLPARGDAADVLDWATKIAIAVLFFLYGTRLEPREALEGLKHWKLHTTVLAATYVLFPLLGLAMRLLVPAVLTDDLYTGVLYCVCCPRRCSPRSRSRRSPAATWQLRWSAHRSQICWVSS